MSEQIDVYRIGWFTHPKLRTNIKHLALPHRPWQASAAGVDCQFARRGWTAKQARRRMERDVAYAVGAVTGYPIESPAQLRHRYYRHLPVYRWWRRKKDATFRRPS